jgi:hypothetical protein
VSSLSLFLNVDRDILYWFLSSFWFIDFSKFSSFLLSDSCTLKRLACQNLWSKSMFSCYEVKSEIRVIMCSQTPMGMSILMLCCCVIVFDKEGKSNFTRNLSNCKHGMPLFTYYCSCLLYRVIVELITQKYLSRKTPKFSQKQRQNCLKYHFTQLKIFLY